MGRADLQGQSTGEGSGNRFDLHVGFGILHVVLPHELDLLDAFRVVVRAKEQNQQLDVLVGNQADLLEVVHEAHKDLVASCQGHEDVDLLSLGSCCSRPAWLLSLNGTSILRELDRKDSESESWLILAARTLASISSSSRNWILLKVCWR